MSFLMREENTRRIFYLLKDNFTAKFIAVWQYLLNIMKILEVKHAKKNYKYQS